VHDKHPSSLSQSERIDVLRFISETHRKARAERRGVHSRTFFTTLTFFAALIAARFSDKVKPPDKHFALFCTVVWILVCVVAGLAAIHLLGLDAANRVNRKLAENAEGELMEMVGLPGPTNAGRWVARFYLWEVAMVVIFAVAAGISLTLL
jgi:hypothetical protein